MQNELWWHECVECGKRVGTAKFHYTCPACDGLLLVERDDEHVMKSVGTGQKARNYFDSLRYGTARKQYPNDSGVWLWRDLLLPGFPEKSIVSLKEGQTDLFEVPSWLGRELGIEKLFIKMEGQAPSESFKDRGMPVAVSDALRLQRENPELGIRGVLCASTGDTSAAAAIYSAYVRDQLDCLVTLPHEKIVDAQLFQAMAHGARVRTISHPDGFDATRNITFEFSKRHPEYMLVNSKNDMRIVGQETIGLEVLQDLNWKVPDWISIPVGNGGNLTALLLALLRAKKFGLIDRLPGIIAGQISVADTLVRWQESKYKEYKPGKFKTTVASAMNINNPVSFPRIKKLYKEFDVHFYRSGEDEIKDAWAQSLRGAANICPQTAVAIHAARQARESGTIKGNDSVVVIAAASALKFSEAGVAYHKSRAKFANPYQKVAGSLEALEASLA